MAVDFEVNGKNQYRPDQHDHAERQNAFHRMVDNYRPNDIAGHQELEAEQHGSAEFPSIVFQAFGFSFSYDTDPVGRQYESDDNDNDADGLDGSGVREDGMSIAPEGMLNINAGLIMLTCFFFAWISGIWTWNC